MIYHLIQIHPSFLLFLNDAYLPLMKVMTPFASPVPSYFSTLASYSFSSLVSHQ
jgi:hypothetical protein